MVVLDVAPRWPVNELTPFGARYPTAGAGAVEGRELGLDVAVGAVVGVDVGDVVGAFVGAVVGALVSVIGVSKMPPAPPIA